MLIFTYIAPERSPIYTPENDDGISLLNEKLLEIKSVYPNADIIIAGDLNARTKDFLDFIPYDDLDFVFGETDYPSDTFNVIRKSKDMDTYNKFGLSLIDLCCEHDVHMLNGRLFDDSEGNVTCVANEGRSLVDYIIASSTLFDKFSYFAVDNHDFSDHFPLTCSLKLRNIVHEQVAPDDIDIANKWVKYKWKESLKQEFLDHFRLQYTNFNNITVNTNQNNVAGLLPEFINVFQKAGKSMKIGSPLIKSSSSHHAQPEWWDQNCSERKFSKNKALRKFRKTNSNEDFREYKVKRNHFRSLCKVKKKQYQKRRQKLLIDSSGRPKEFWTLIKSGKNKSTPENNISNNDWITYFQNLFSSQDNQSDIGPNHPLQNISQNNDTTVLESEITEAEIRYAIGKLKTDRSGGPDGLSIEMYKAVLDIIMPFLCVLFNDIYNSGIFPDAWCDSIISPIHKSGSVDNPENYRAISLINCLCKFFMNILTIRLTDWAESNNVIDESQAGFRKGYGTIDNIFSLQSLIQKYLCRSRGRFYCIFIDFKRAFDSIQHANLWDSLIRKGINHDCKFLTIFKSMYSQLKSCVKVKNGLTQYFNCYIGTRQGCVSSPIIFSLFINDLVSYIKSECDRGIFVTEQIADIFALMFADDVASFSDTIVRLQHQINCIETFCLSVGMQLNLLKTKIIVFRNGGVLKQTEKWFYMRAPIDVSFYKYLGVYFTPKLVWSKTKEVLALQASKAVFKIFQYQRQFGYFCPKDIFKLFDSIVRPILCYGSEIWGYEYCETIEKVQIKFCKRYACLHQNTADFFALGECGRYPLAVTYMTQCVKYWVRLIQMPNYRYPKQCYIMLRSQAAAGKSNWAEKIRLLLYQHGFGYVWEADTVGDAQRFINIFKQRLIDCFSQQWHSQVEESSKALHYKHFKLILEIENYLCIDLPFTGMIQ